MASRELLRDTTIPIAHGGREHARRRVRDADPRSAHDATGDADSTGSGFPTSGLRRAIPQRRRRRRCDACGIRGGQDPAGGCLPHHTALEHQSSPRAGQACVRGKSASTAGRSCRLLSYPYAVRIPAGRRAGSERRAWAGGLRPRRHTGRDLAGSGAACRRRSLQGNRTIGYHPWTGCARSSAPPGSSRPWCRSSPIHTSLSGDLLDFCREHKIILLAFAALGHGMKPRPAGRSRDYSIARSVHKTPAQVALAWAVQRGTAFLTDFDQTGIQSGRTSISRPFPEDAMRKMREDISTNVRYNEVVKTGVPGFIPKSKLTTRIERRSACDRGAARSRRAGADALPCVQSRSRLSWSGTGPQPTRATSRPGMTGTGSCRGAKIRRTKASVGLCRIDLQC